MPEPKLYRFRIGPIECRNMATGELMFEQGGIVYENMDKANVELLEGELIALLQRLHEYSKQKTAGKKN